MLVLNALVLNSCAFKISTGHPIIMLKAIYLDGIELTILAAVSMGVSTRWMLKRRKADRGSCSRILTGTSAHTSNNKAQSSYWIVLPMRPLDTG